MAHHSLADSPCFAGKTLSLARPGTSCLPGDDDDDGGTSSQHGHSDDFCGGDDVNISAKIARILAEMSRIFAKMFAHA